MKPLKIAIGSDHGGLQYKESIISQFNSAEFEFIDVGTYTTDSCDYPVIAKQVSEKVVKGEADRGILVCGTGIGMSIAANKVKGIRAALCGETYSARLTRQHNDSNVLCIGQRVIGESLAFDIVEVWLKTEFDGGRHKRRVDMLE